MLNQKLTLRIYTYRYIYILYESSAVKDTRYQDKVWQGDWHGWIWSSNTEAQLNGMLCEFRSTSAHLAIVLLRDTFSYDDLKQTLCQGWQW